MQWGIAPYREIKPTKAHSEMETSPNDRIQPPIEAIYRIAKQYSRRPEEVDDLVQDLLLEAVSTGKDFSHDRFMAWGRGFLRNRAAFIARTEGRRRKREEEFHPHGPDSDATAVQLPKRFIVALRPSLRIIARLINCGLNKKEIHYLLGIADTALRQRLTALRREWRTYLNGLGSSVHIDESTGTLPSGLIRRSLIRVVKRAVEDEARIPGGILGSHDPDGHLFTIRSRPAHKTGADGNNNADNAG